MKRLVLSPQMVHALRSLSTVRYLPQPAGVRLTTLQALRRARLVLRRWRPCGCCARYRMSAAGSKALLWAPRRAS